MNSTIDTKIATMSKVFRTRGSIPPAMRSEMNSPGSSDPVVARIEARTARVVGVNGPKIVDVESILVGMIPRLPTKVSASGIVAIWPPAGPGT
jgi:hypothetical protein